MWQVPPPGAETASPRAPDGRSVSRPARRRSSLSPEDPGHRDILPPGMRDHLDGLSRLHRITEAQERRAVFRTAMASLAHAATELRPVPLEGQDPAALKEGAKV